MEVGKWSITKRSWRGSLEGYLYVTPSPPAPRRSAFKNAKRPGAKPGPLAGAATRPPELPQLRVLRRGRFTPKCNGSAPFRSPKRRCRRGPGPETSRANQAHTCCWRRLPTQSGCRWWDGRGGDWLLRQAGLLRRVGGLELVTPARRCSWALDGVIVESVDAIGGSLAVPSVGVFGGRLGTLLGQWFQRLKCWGGRCAACTTAPTEAPQRGQSKAKLAPFPCT